MPPDHKFPFIFPLLNSRCPHCHEDTVFGMVSKAAKELGIIYGKVYYIRCGACGHDKAVEDGKADVWQRLRKAYEGLATDKLTQEQFDTILQAADAPEINELLEESQNWTCECGEENPMNFGECWSCGAETTGPVKDSPDVNIDTGDSGPAGIGNIGAL